MPRLSKTQRNRENHETASAEEYYRVTIFIPLLDDIIEQLEVRFSQQNRNALKLAFLLPKNMKRVEKNEESMRDAFTFYRKIFSEFSIDEALGELDIWREIWKEKDEVPVDGLETIKKCDANSFPVIHRFLTILTTLPVSSASPERSFSTLKRLKTWLRNRMGQDRLSDLALMAMHPSTVTYADTGEILRIFAAKKSRRLDIQI